MGLDQNIYRVSKPNLENKVYTAEEICAIELCKASVEEFEKDIYLLGQLKPYVVKRDVECQFYDRDKMIADYNLPKDAGIWRFGGGGVTIGGADKDGNRIDQVISDAEIQEKYIKTETLPHYIWKQEEVKYWRKYYDLQDWVYENVENVDNTAYCILDKGLIMDLNEMFNEDIPVEEPTDESALFYWEWY